MKKRLFVATVIAFFVCLFATVSCAAEKEDYFDQQILEVYRAADGFEYQFDYDVERYNTVNQQSIMVGVRIIGYSGDEESVTIPNMVDEYEVISVSSFSGNDIVQEIRFLPGCTRIDSYSFSGCSKLKKVVCSDTINYIGESAFVDCKELNTFIAKGKDLRIEQYALYDTNLRVVFIDNSAKYQSNTFPPNTIKAHNQFLYNQYRLFTVFPSEYYFLNMSLAVVTEVLLLIVLIYFCMWVVSYTMFRFGRRNSYTYSRYCKDFCKRIVERTYLSDLHLKKQKSPFFVIVYGIITYSFFVLFLIVSEVIAKATFIYWGMPGAFGLLLSSFLFLAITVILLKLFFKIREKQIQVIGTRKDIDIRVKHYRCGGEHHE